MPVTLGVKNHIMLDIFVLNILIWNQFSEINFIAVNDVNFSKAFLKGLHEKK